MAMNFGNRQISFGRSRNGLIKFICKLALWFVKVAHQWKSHQKDWTADHITTNVDRRKHPNVYTVLDEINVLSKKDMRKIAYWPKILNARNPFTRLYSAWNDKATSFPMHYNGSITYNGIDLMSRFRNKTELVMFIQQNTHKYNDRYHRQGSSQVFSAKAPSRSWPE